MMTPPYRILIIGPSWVGDTIMAQCLLKQLKQRYANVSIDVLAPAWTFALLSRMPEVNAAIEMPIGHGELKLFTRYAIAKKLRAGNYDQAIVLPNSFKSALIPWLAHIPKRTGWLGESRYGVLNDYRRLDKKRYPRMIDQYLALGLDKEAELPASYPAPAFSIDEERAKNLLSKHQISLGDKKILALCPGAEFGPSKRWPEEYYAAVANYCLDQGHEVWLFGSTKDKPIIDDIMQQTQHRAVHLGGKLRLDESIDLLSLADSVVTNDSGLLHAAAALQKPTIAIYGSTSPSFTPPLSESAVVLQLSLECQPCFQRDCPLLHHRCMRDLTPDLVLNHLKAWGM